MFEVDPTTGLHALPPGYFWRVKKTSWRNNYGDFITGYGLQLMKERKILRFLSPPYVVHFTPLDEYRLAEDDDVYLRNMSSYVYRDWQRDEKEKVTLQGRLGDYPPNSV